MNVICHTTQKQGGSVGDPELAARHHHHHETRPDWGLGQGHLAKACS